MDRLFPTRTPGQRAAPPITPPTIPRGPQRIREFSGLLSGVTRPPPDPLRTPYGPQAVWKNEAVIPFALAPVTLPLDRSATPPERAEGVKPRTPSAEEGDEPDPVGTELDPTTRAVFQLRPPETTPGAPLAAMANLEQAAELLLRKVGWGRSGTRAHVQLRIGEGRFANAAISLESDAQQRVTVRVVGGADVNLAALGDVLRSRFERGGLEIDLELEAK
jgi:hypothetical protein